MDGKQLIAMMAILLSGLFYSCSSDEVPANGTLKVHLTDAPFPTDLVTEANVTINKIEIRKKDDSQGSPFITLSEEVMDFNMLDLTNGVTGRLVDLSIEAGEYDLVRLYVSDAGIKLKDGSEYTLKIPSGAETGIKVFITPALVVKGGLTAELLLDLDVRKSFVLKGDISSPAGIEGFNFTPVIKAANLSTTGRLVGHVKDAEEAPVEGVQVTVMDGEEVYTTTFTDADGNYAVLGVDAGLYTLVFEKEGYRTITTDEAEVFAANKTTVDAQMAVVEVAE